MGPGQHRARVSPDPTERGRGWRWAAGLTVTAVTVVWCVTWISTPSTLGLRGWVTKLDQAHGTTPITPSQVPRYLAEGVIAVEDQNFYLDRGVNLEGLLRAAGYDIVNHCACQGGSTITEQLAEDAYLHGSDSSLWGRWVDITLALKIEDHLTKTQVLDAYLSEVHLGAGTVGFAQASLKYFHRPLSRDDLAQLALLAGLPQAPTLLDPLSNPEGAVERRAIVLGQMATDGYITWAQAHAAERAPAL